jgi:hypothetical protein
MNNITNYFTPLGQQGRDEDGQDGNTMGGQSQKRMNSNQRIKQRPRYQLQHLPRMLSQQTIEHKKNLTRKRIVSFAAQRRATRQCHTGDTTTSVKKRPLLNKAEVNPPHKKLMEYYKSANNKPLTRDEKFNQLPSREVMQAFWSGETRASTAQSVPNQTRDRLVGSLSFSGVKHSSNKDSTTRNESNVLAPVVTVFASECTSIANELNNEGKKTIDNEGNDTTMDASTLHKVLDERMLDGGKKPRVAQQKMVPEPIVFMMWYIQSHFPDRFKSGSNEVPDTDRAREPMN